jgi:hypothetical protein
VSGHSRARGFIDARAAFSVINLMGRRTWPMKLEMTRTYHTRRGQLIYLALFSAGWFAFVIGMSARRVPDQWTGRDIGAAILAILFALLPAYLTARIPHTVIVSDEGTCSFRSLIRSRSVRAQQIRSISYDEGDLTLHLDRGALNMKVVDDLHGFLAQLVELNPALELPRGWRAELDKRPNSLHEGPCASEAEAQEVAGSSPHPNFVLRILSRLATAAVMVFIFGFVLTWLVHPLPHWVIPLMLAAFGVAFGSSLLYWAVAGFSDEVPASDGRRRPGDDDLREDAVPEAALAHWPFEKWLQFAIWWIGLTFMSLGIYEIHFSDGHIDGSIFVDLDFTVEVLACAVVGWLATRLLLSAGRKGWIS